MAFPGAGKVLAIVEARTAIGATCSCLNAHVSNEDGISLKQHDWQWLRLLRPASGFSMLFEDLDKLGMVSRASPSVSMVPIGLQHGARKLVDKLWHRGQINAADGETHDRPGG